MALQLALLPIAAMFKTIAVLIFFRILFSLGVGIAVFTGFNFLLDQVKIEMFNSFSDAGALFPIVIDFLGLLQVDVFINLIVSALAIRIAIKAPSGILKRFFIG